MSGKTAKKTSGSSVNAPAQRSQSSRKGKRAWRKNVDLDDVEEALEEARTEERVTGYVVSDK
jgi:nucleolar protein 53